MSLFKEDDLIMSLLEVVLSRAKSCSERMKRWDSIQEDELKNLLVLENLLQGIDSVHGMIDHLVPHLFHLCIKSLKKEEKETEEEFQTRRKLLQDKEKQTTKIIKELMESFKVHIDRLFKSVETQMYSLDKALGNKIMKQAQQRFEEKSEK